SHSERIDVFDDRWTRFLSPSPDSGMDGTSISRLMLTLDLDLAAELMALFVLAVPRLGVATEPGWQRCAVARLIHCAALLRPRRSGADFLEEECANLAASRSRREKSVYLAGLLLDIPLIAWTYHREAPCQRQPG